MGRPVNKRYFGDPANLGSQLVFTAKLNGSAAQSAYVVKQLSTRRFRLADTATGLIIKDCTLVDKASGSLALGECLITATPFGGSAKRVSKIMSRRIDTFDGNSYKWSTYAAAATGEADLLISGERRVQAVASVTTIDVDGIITLITVDTVGSGYRKVPTVTIVGDGTGAIVTAVMSGDSVSTITIVDGGADYTTATVVIEAP